MQLKEINKKYGIQARYGITETMALAGLKHAIHGHSGGLGISRYRGLIPGRERKRLLVQHKERHGLEIGFRSLYTGTGIHALTKKQRRKHGRLTGPEAGRASARARGYVPWDEKDIDGVTEGEMASILSEDPMFRRHNGVNSDLLKKFLNDTFHDGKPVRTVRSVQRIVREYRKKMGHS